MQSLDQQLNNETVAHVQSHLANCLSENVYFKRAYKPKLLNNKQLKARKNAIADHFRTKIKAKLFKRTTSVALDGWTNKHINQKYINFLLLNRDTTFFWKTLEAEVDSVTGEYLFDQVSALIDDLKKKGTIPRFGLAFLLFCFETSEAHHTQVN